MKGPLSRSGAATAFGLFAIAVYVFLYLPVITMVVLSFNNSIGIGLPWGGFTTRWYRESLENALARNAFLSSVQLAVVVSLVSSSLGLGVALAFRRAFRGKALMLNALILPLLMPGIVLAVGQITLWNLLGLLPGLWGTALLGHLVYTVPFAFLNIFPRVHRFDPNIEAAAADLGAGPWTVFATILLPRILPGLLASALFCFTLSFDEFTRTLFLIGAENTLPIYFWSIILTDPSPAASAIATLSVLFSLGIVALGLLALSGRRRGRAALAGAQG
ncbi:ABC transporter permease [Siccirubricoccus phaeus]|uniref:ABC transporter permease n=1 Tax=Siccirubricoccus phaeus TaxID=2595053 RepID=UPI0011F3F195|nr:ABC transporter permease [Siccirubricoccus phaeus]